MAITLNIGARFFGLTADTKPTLGVNNIGAEFYETDEIHRKFFWTGAQWEERALS